MPTPRINSHVLNVDTITKLFDLARQNPSNVFYTNNKGRVLKYDTPSTKNPTRNANKAAQKKGYQFFAAADDWGAGVKMYLRGPKQQLVEFLPKLKEHWDGTCALGKNFGKAKHEKEVHILQLSSPDQTAKQQDKPLSKLFPEQDIFNKNIPKKAGWKRPSWLTFSR